MASEEITVTMFHLSWRGRQRTGHFLRVSAALKRLVSFRPHNPDEDEASDLLIEDKRQKKEASCIEEELLNYTYNLVSKGRRKLNLNQAKLQS